MIRTKAKSLLLSIMLLVASLCFFACKEQSKINVESITFTEQSISMLVGEQYTPDVKVLPSYASNRSYTLITNDVTALKIEGGSITALKVATDVKLKVVSNENNNLNDIVSINIYAEASQLETPTELKFDGSKFTFVGKDNANAYMLKIGENEINIGNNTEYSLNSVVDKVGDMYNKVVSCQVKALGDGKIFTDSDYCDEISFVKLSSVKNAYVENETLYFDSIQDVASYNVEILNNGQVKHTKVVHNSSFEAKQLSLSLDNELVDSVLGAEYTIQITPNIAGYKVENVEVFNGTATSVDYAVIGQAKNLTINNKTISWDFVKNAQNYTVALYYNGELKKKYENVVANSIQIEESVAGEYYCEILANSSKANTTTGKLCSEKLNFNILQAPVIVADNNSVSWDSVSKAEGYLVTIKNDWDRVLVDNQFVLQNSYDITTFGYGTYYISVVACGNGQEVVTSKSSTVSSWTKLEKLLIKVEKDANGKETIYWQDLDKNSLHKYKLTFAGTTITTSSANYDENKDVFSYDISNINFTAGTHEITIQSLGKGSIFDAEITKTSIIKLAESEITSLEEKEFTIKPVENGTKYEIKVYDSSELNNEILSINTMNGYKFKLDDSSLGAGEYVAKVFVYGNGHNIFDANNGDVGTTLSFTKLNTPTIEVDASNLKLVVGNVADAKGYVLQQNGNKVDLVDQVYGLSNLVAGDYVYIAKAIGDNATILDSNETTSQNQIKIKRIAMPTITFDKNELTYTLKCDDSAYIKDYTFTLNDELVVVENGVADCKDLIKDAKEYVAKVMANPITDLEGTEYKLIIASDNAEHTATKLAGACKFEISNGTMTVTPDAVLGEGSYGLNLRIENADKSINITLEQFTYSNPSFVIDLYNDKYELVNQAIASLFENAGEYTIYTMISKADKGVVTSDEVVVANTLKVLNRVTTIAKSAQTIEFNVVENASNYIAFITVDGKEYDIDLAGNYSVKSSDNTKNVLQMSDLLKLMEENSVPYKEQTPYSIKFVTTKNEDKHTMANKGVDSYTFEFLKAPTLSIIEQEGANTKYLSITTDDTNVAKYNVSITQNEVVNNIKETTEILINMDAMTQLGGGNVKIEVSSLANAGDYFESSKTELNVTKLEELAISVVEGLLQWDSIDNAKQYNLVYSNPTGSGVIVLTEGVENFTMKDSKCVYNFDTLVAGSSELYVQVDSIINAGEQFYLNSNAGEVRDVYKLPTPNVTVANGLICVTISSADFERVSKLEFMLDGELIDIGINVEESKPKTEQKGISLVENANSWTITIDPGIIAPATLLKYGAEELLGEIISLKLYSNNEQTLNSSVGNKLVKGLLTPTGLDITTSKTSNEQGVIDEVLEKIEWVNPTSNEDYVYKYEIIINYKEVDYVFNSSQAFLMMPKYCDYDANDNGELDYNEDLNENGQLDAGEDVNGNGVLDKVEVVFGAGVYTIKVRALTDNNESVVNSRYCEEIQVTILENPKDLTTKDGNITWSDDIAVQYYLIKVYLLSGNDKTLIASTQTKTNVSEFDLCSIKPLTEGIYGVTIQAMHDNKLILSSYESEILQVIRLPQVASYFVKDGEFYINAHSFFTKAEIYLTDKKTGATTYTFTLANNDIAKYEEMVKDSAFKGWTTSNVISTYQNENYILPFKYLGDGTATLREALAGAYGVKIKLYGNTTENGVGSIISGHTNTQPINSYWEENTSVEDKNQVEKLVVPTIEVSDTKRGVMLLSIPNGINYSLRYFIDGDKALEGVHIYQIDVATDKQYTMYIAEIVDNTLFEASLNAVGSELIVDPEEKFNLKHFEYNGFTFNVIDKTTQGHIEFDFNTNAYYYYPPTSQIDGATVAGVYSYIDLSLGGTFVATARFLGDDTQFVKSNLTAPATIKRYNVLNLTINNGVISWLNQANDVDHPIYLINLSNELDEYNLVLYNPSVHNPKDLLGCLESGKEYVFDTISYETTDERIVYKGLADIVAKLTTERIAQLQAELETTTNTEEREKISAKITSLTNLFGKGWIFISTVKAHYTDSASNDIILAQGGESKTVAVLPSSQINIVDGVLSWKLSSISTSGGEQCIYDYALQIFEGETKLYEIELGYDPYNNVGDYNISNNIATYQLPRTLTGEDGGEFEFTPNYKYTFKLVALGGDSATYINSSHSSSGETQLLSDLQDVRMENGVLTWTNTTTSNVEIYITYTLGDSVVRLEDVTSGNSYNLPASFTDTSGTLRHLIAGYEYSIKLRLKGSETVLNGFFSELKLDGAEFKPQRLSTVDANTIVTNNGVVTWDDSVFNVTGQDGKTTTSSEGIKYTVKYTITNPETSEVIASGTTEQLDKPEFDFMSIVGGTQFPSGIVAIQIYAHHNNHFTSFISDKDGSEGSNDAVKMFKLQTPTNIKYHEETTIISWDKIVDNNGNEVNTYMVAVKQGEEVKEYKCETNQWIITGVTSNAFSIAVKAINVEESENIINSDYTEYQSMALPYSVDVATFEYDDNLKAFKWKAIQDEQVGDEYYIGYTYYDAILSTNPNATQTVVEPIFVSKVEKLAESDEQRYYYYYPNKIGSYRLIYVQVVRAESLSAQPTYCENEDGTKYGLDFDLFASGDGVNTVYTIESEGQLRNIKYFPNAKYLLLKDISLTSTEPIMDSSQVFSGAFDGNNKSIISVNAISGGFNTHIGLFNRVEGASFTKLILSNFNISGYLTSENLYLGILAGQAKDSTFNNITVSASSINITKDNAVGYLGDVSAYIGAIVGHSTDCSFTQNIINFGGSQANVIINIKGTSQTKVAIGGVSGYADNCSLKQNTSNGAKAFISSCRLSAVYQELPKLYIGALVGVADENGVTLTNNSCSYAEQTADGLVDQNTAVGQYN